MKVTRLAIAIIMFASGLFATGSAIRMQYVTRYRVGAICNDGWQSKATPEFAHN